MRSAMRFRITVVTLVLAMALLPIGEVNAWVGPGQRCTEATINVAIGAMIVLGGGSPWGIVGRGLAWARLYQIELETCAYYSN